MSEDIEAIRIHWLAQNEAITRIRELHKPLDCDCMNDTCESFCSECSNDDVLIEYPCPTIKALDGEK